MYNDNCGDRSDIMTKFISNVNRYLSEMKIKQSYLSMITGIEKNKLSRLLTGVQEETGSDMEKIADGLGKSIEYFLSDSMSIEQVDNFSSEKISFYVGEPSSKQKQISSLMVELVKNVDVVLGAENRFVNISRGK